MKLCDSSDSQLSCRRDTSDDFPANADDYELVEEIGVGATARVRTRRRLAS